MIIAAVDDLLFASKIRAAADRAGRSVTFVRSAPEVASAVLAARPELTIFDLDRPALEPVAAIRAVRADERGRQLRLVAFVRHTSADAIRAARDAGVDVVLARSAFFPALEAMLKDLTSSASTA
jgi:CheY-like chemotaxis protein